jgi:subtilisin-like proprotein convertase family protein
MIKAANNIFLDVNDATIIIEEVTTPTFFLAAQKFSKTECANVNKSTFQFEYTPSSLFTETVTFTATGEPEGSTVVFTPSEVSDSKEMITMTIEGFSDADTKDYSITVNGTSLTQNKTQIVVLTLKGTDFSLPVLKSPINESDKQSTYPLYTWSEGTNGVAESFDVEIGTDINFSEIIETAEVSKGVYSQNKGLRENTQYFWRVKPKNECGNGDFSSVSSFTTGPVVCSGIENNNLSLIVSELTVTSRINIAADIPISDINVSMEITHPFIKDLIVVLTSPSGTAVTLMSSECADGDPDVDAIFDDLGVEGMNCSSTSPAISGTVKPVDPLSAFNGESSMGSWSLSITDTGLGDDGVLTSWGIEYCGVEKLSLANEKFDNSLIQVYPNPAKNRITVKFEKTATLDVVLFDLLGRQVLSTSLEYSGKTIDVSALSPGTYIMQLTDDENRRTSKKIIVE